jgi:hypothetical protein
MYTIKNNAIVPVSCKDIVMHGAVQDANISIIETIVASAYNTKVSQLDVFYKDTPAKFMCCFLIHDLLQYTVRSIAVKYGVYKYFLDNHIQEHYKNCLIDPAFMDQVNRLRNDFNNIKLAALQI